MSNSAGDGRHGAVGLALLATGCISTGEPLFTEDTGVAASPSTETAPAAPAVPEGASSGVASAPEPVFEAGRDVPLPVAPNPVGPAAPAAMSAEPEVAVDPCVLEGVILCDSFEDAIEGAFPIAEGWLPELAGCGSHSVDGAGPAFSGTRALRVDEGGYPECMLHADSSGVEELFVRTRVFLGGGEALGEYLSLLEFGARPDQDDPELRVGVRPENDDICEAAGLDVTGTGLSTGSRTDCTGFVLEPERWYCIEGHLTRSGENLSLTLSVDGTEVASHDFVGSSAWDGSDLFVKLGRAGYGSSPRGSIWHDDVAVSRQPAPCGP